MVETELASVECFRVGDCLVQPRLGKVRREGVELRLEPRVIDLPVVLVRRAGDVLSKEELIDEVWQVEVVGDGTLSHSIATLRKALGDDARNPRYIETVHKRGYRMLVTAKPEAAPPAHLRAVPATRSEDAVRPYPGLAPFSAADAPFFFGREVELEQMLHKLKERRLLALIGPSGVGKSSFVQAGLIPFMPAGWHALSCRPGANPYRGVALELAPELAGDPEATRRLIQLDDPDSAVEAVSRWRRMHSEAVLVIDQLEELFTLNPAEVQRSFSKLLGRLVRQAGVRFLLVMRDDFFYRCHALPDLKPVFEDVTPLATPAGEALRRILVEPARHAGFELEDPGLVDEIISSLDDERGALPLLAFAAARLWEHRDIERRLLTRDAYERIGGIGGALAAHAEATLVRIGHDRLDLVRELFRNLATAQGTRVSQDADVLLSVFPEGDRGAAGDVLWELVDARLLTTYEAHIGDGQPRRHVELIHESLLERWPRLVRWQTQDADAAQLRDQLRQAAVLWDGRGRPPDLLWTGSSYRELAVWRETYGGGLTDIEEAFIDAATIMASRARRRRRTVAAVAFVLLMVAASVVTTLWRRSTTAQQSAEAAARQTEAGRLLALARLELDGDRTRALAFVTASLRYADTDEARRFAVQVLWQGPTAIVLPPAEDYALTQWVEFSPDGHWLALADREAGFRVYSENGGEPTLAVSQPGVVYEKVGFGPDSVTLYTSEHDGGQDGVVRFWSLEEGKATGMVRAERRLVFVPKLSSDGSRLVAPSMDWIDTPQLVVETWDLDPAPTRIGRWQAETSGPGSTDVSATASHIAFAQGRDLYVAPTTGAHPRRAQRRVGTHGTNVEAIRFSPSGDVIAASDVSGEILLWSVSGNGRRPLRRFSTQTELWWLEFDPLGVWLFSGHRDGSGSLWGLDGPPGIDPIRLGCVAASVAASSFHPSGRWIVSCQMDGPLLWWLGRSYPRVLRTRGGGVRDVAIAPDGSSVAWSSADGSVHLVDRRFGTGSGTREIYRSETVSPAAQGVVFDPKGRFLVTSCWGEVLILPLNGDAPRSRRMAQHWVPLAVDAQGRRIAAGGGNATPPEDRLIRIWDLETDSVREVNAGDQQWYGCLQFTRDGHLLAANGENQLLRWDLATGEHAVLLEDVADFVPADDGRSILVVSEQRLSVHDLEQDRDRDLPRLCAEITAIDLDPTGAIAVAGCQDGIIQVGRVTGEEPHLLLGHKGAVRSVAVSPDGRWIVSGGLDGTVRMWPMPDLDKTPLHSLPHDDLVAKLEAFTNLRAVADDSSPDGWVLEAGPFPGWANLPEW